MYTNPATGTNKTRTNSIRIERSSDFVCQISENPQFLQR